ncbi:MAG: type VI secretion system tube protein Hcp [Cellvibrionaceae bacterium]|nr:type VI secretion system tube protein Hcp [Cellvibrionaceae bacterium]
MSAPKIFIEFCCGTGKDVTLSLTKTGAGSGADVYMQYILKNALISGYNVRGSEHDTNRPIEDITISFVDIEVKYTPLRHFWIMSMRLMV